MSTVMQPASVQNCTFRHDQPLLVVLAGSPLLCPPVGSIVQHPCHMHVQLTQQRAVQCLQYWGLVFCTDCLLGSVSIDPWQGGIQAEGK